MHQRSNIRDEAVVPGHQLVELAAGRQVLILEARRAVWRRGSEHVGDDLVVDRGEDVAHAGKEATDAQETMIDGIGARRTQRELLTGAREPIDPLRVDTFSANRPQLIAQVLLYD